MFSLLILPFNRGLTQKSPVLVRNINNSIHCRCKNTLTKGVAKSILNEKASNRDKMLKNVPFLNNPKSRELISINDRDDFGTFDRKIAETIDAGDITDDEHSQTIPRRKDQASEHVYENMIKKCIRDKMLKEAIDVINVRMKTDRVQPNYYMYELLIIECGRLGYTKKSFQLYNQMKKRGLRVTGPIYTALFTSCAHSIHPTVALEHAKNLRKIVIQNGFPLNELIYNAMIKAFGRCGDIETAFQLVDEMKDKKLRMKTDTINHMLQACISDKKYGFRHALLVWQKFYQRNLTPDTYSFNLMLRCTRDCDFGNLQEMKKVIGTLLTNSATLLQMKSRTKKTILVDDKPTTSINPTDTHEKVDDEIFPQIARDEIPNLLAKLPHLGSVIKLQMVKSPEDRLMLLGGLSGVITEMENFKVRPSTKTFSQLLDIIPSTLEAEHELIEKMRHMRVRADVDFFNLLMKRRFLRQDGLSAMKVLQMIDHVNLDPDIVTYGILAMRCKNRNDAKHFIEELNAKGIRLNIEILGTLMRNAAYNKDCEYCIDLLNYAMNEGIKPSSRFVQIMSKFKNSQFYAMKMDGKEEAKAKYSQFYRVYKRWQEQMELLGLSLDEATKLLNVHPWKQLKESPGEGIEILKNKRTRRYWKRQHTLERLNPSRLKRLDMNSTTTDNVDHQ